MNAHGSDKSRSNYTYGIDESVDRRSVDAFPIFVVDVLLLDDVPFDFAAAVVPRHVPG